MRDAGGGAGSFRGAAAGTAAAHRTSTPPDRDDPPPPPHRAWKQAAGSSGRRLPADRCRGPARGPESAGRRFPSAARAFVAVTRWARAASARSGRARSSAGRPDLDAVAPAGQRGPDTCRWDGRLPGCDALCRAPVPGCAGPPPGAEPPAVEASNPNQNTAARPASEAHAPRGFRWERGRPIPPRSASPDSLGQLLSLLVACRLAQEKPTRVPGARQSPLGQTRGPRAAVTLGPDGKHQENSLAPRAGDGSSRRPY